MRKQNHIPNRHRVGENHDEPIDADAFAGGWRKAVFEGADVVLVHDVRFGVPAALLFELLFEPAALFDRVVQLAERIGDLETRDVQLEPLHRVGIVGLLLRER